ncbi:MAG: cell division protein FtsQ/DivIB [Pseudomonadota bacterium]
MRAPSRLNPARRKAILGRWRKRPKARTLVAVAVLAGLAAAAGPVYELMRDGAPRLGEWAGRAAGQALAASADLGLSVEEVFVEGRVETPAADVLSALGIRRGAPILALRPDAAKAELEKLPWVREAAVERLLPDTVRVRLVERQPLALWQRHGRLALIGRDGREIRGVAIARFAQLPILVGEDAPPHAAALFGLLASEPDLDKRVAAAVRVGGRRWNVRLDNGIDVQLPESNAGAAWARLAELEREDRVLARNIISVDLRLPDRLVVRVVRPPPPVPPPKRPGRPA